MGPAVRDPFDSVAGAFVATWRTFLKDFGAVLLLFVGVFVYSFFYPLPYSNQLVRGMPIAVVDQDRSALSRQLIRYAAADPLLDVRLISPLAQEAQAALWRGEVAGVLIIPAGLQKDVSRGTAAKVQAGGNALYMLMNKSVLNGLTQSVGTVSAGLEIRHLEANTPSPHQAMAQRAPVTLDAISVFNPDDGYGAYVVPGVVVIIVQQTLLLAMALLWGTWFERGERPARRSTPAFFGVLLAFASVAFINSAYFFGFVYWWQDYPRGGNFGGMVFFMVLFSLTVAAVGFLLATFFRTRERGAQLLLCTAIPFLFVAGFLWPVQALPPLLRALRWVLPSTAGIEGFIALNQLGARLDEIATEITALLVLLLAAGSAAWWRWRHSGPQPAPTLPAA